ncbi:MAG: hypothetical protein KDH96_07840, partial [Candidatus Riesia sp.]|nr:hypothetical protein [Candidatus Riesia sp.]
NDRNRDILHVLIDSLIQTFDINKCEILIHHWFAVNIDNNNIENGISKINNSDTHAIIEILKKYINGLEQYMVRNVNCNIISLKRVMAGYCEICDRDHQNENACIYFNNNDMSNLSVTFKCFRNNSQHINILLPVSEFPSDSFVLDKVSADKNKKMSKSSKMLDDIIKSQNMLLNSDIFLRGIKNLFKNENNYDISSNQRYMKPIPLDFNTVYIRGGMGSGKTEQLVKYLRQRIYEDKNLTIVIISFRKTFTSKMHEDFKELGFMSYQETPGPISHQRIIIQAESFKRLVYKDIDILVMDEVKSIFSQISSTKTDNINFITSYSKLHAAMKSSITLICIDAYLDETIVRCVGSFRDYSQTFLLKNDYPTEKDRVYHLTCSRDVILTKINNFVADGKKIAIATYSIKYSESLRQLILKNNISCIKAEEIMVYNSNTETSVKRSHFKNVNSQWKKYKVIIYTSTIKAGISCTIPFDAVFGLFGFADIKMSAEDYIQMMGRIRNCNEFYVFLQPYTDHTCDLSPSYIQNIIYSNIRYKIYCEMEKNNTTNQLTKYTESIPMYIFIAHKQCMFYTQMNFVNRFCMLFKQYGAVLRYIDMDDVDYSINAEFKSFNSIFSLNLSTDIAKSKDITNDEYNEYRIKIQNDIELTNDEQNSIKKIEFRNIYDLYDVDITPQLVYEFYNKNLINSYIMRNLLMKMKFSNNNQIQASGIERMINLIANPDTGAINFINFKSCSNILYHMHFILQYCGFQYWFDMTVLDHDVFDYNFKTNCKKILNCLNNIRRENKRTEIKDKSFISIKNRVLDMFKNTMDLNLCDTNHYRISWHCDFDYYVNEYDLEPQWVKSTIKKIFGSSIHILKYDEYKVFTKPTIHVTKNVVSYIKLCESSRILINNIYDNNNIY